MTALLGICKTVWNEQPIPNDQKTALIIINNNYRKITLLCTTMKIYEPVVNKQSGFRKGVIIQDHTLAVKQKQKLLQQGKDVYLGFIDVEKAVDSVPRMKLWKILEERKNYTIYRPFSPTYKSGVITRRQRSKILAVEMKYLRRMKGVTK